MRKILVVLLIALLAGCAHNNSGSEDLTNFIPDNSVVILKLQDPDLFFSNLKNNEFLRKNNAHPLSKQLQARLSLLDFLPHNDPAYLSFSLSKDNTPDFTFISRGEENVTIDSVKNKMVETFTTKDQKITKYTIEDQVAYMAVKDSIHIFSSSKELLENSLTKNEHLKRSSDFQKAMKASSAQRPGIFVNHQLLTPVLKKWFPRENFDLFNSFSNWTVVDADITQSDIKLNGITTAGDTIPKSVNIFKGVGAAENLLAGITPLSSKGFYSITFREFSKLNQNLRTYRKDSLQKGISKEQELLETASEAGMIYIGDSEIFAVRTLDLEAAKIAMSSQQDVLEEFRDISIFKYSDQDDFRKLLKPLITPENLEAFIYLDQFVLFSESSEALKEVITSFQNDQVMIKSEAYTSSFESLSTESSILLVSDNSNFKNVMAGSVSEEYKEATEELNFKNFPLTALQFIYQSNFAHVHAVLSKNKTQKINNSTSQVAMVNLGADLATRPFFFKNHRTNGMDIAVQDVGNTLYLISPSGKIYWKKKLGSRILGEIQSVDILKNGRYQLAFATQNKVHVIDREGNVVKPFPLEFKDEITQPLAIFDYDNDRDYRFVVVQNDRLYMYDNKGKSVHGFSFSKASDRITQTPKHIRIGRKDYILVPEASGKLNILSRTGKTRVSVKEKIDFSGNDWYEYNGRFVSTNKSGELLKISEKGNIQRENLQLSENHQIDATIKSLVSLSENVLNIKGNKVNLDFGLYSAPEIFYINNKIYVSVTDTQAHKVYLFDSSGKLLPGFPIYGNSRIDLANADRDSSPELVVKGEDDSVLLYEIQ